MKPPAVLVEANGHARVVGKNSAYFMALDHRPEICVDGKPLTVRHVKVWKLSAGATFDLRTWAASGGSSFEANVVDGKMTSSADPQGAAQTRLDPQRQRDRGAAIPVGWSPRLR